MITVKTKLVLHKLVLYPTETSAKRLKSHIVWQTIRKLEYGLLAHHLLLKVKTKLSLLSIKSYKNCYNNVNK